VEIFKKYRSGSVPVGIGTSVGTDEETIVITDLDHLLEADVNMRSIVVIGNTTSKVINNWLITPRGYQV
jgi:precorrin-3B methylase